MCPNPKIKPYLDQLQSAYNNIRSINNEILSERDKYKIYMRMNFIYNILSETTDIDEEALKKYIDDILSISRASFIKQYGKKEFFSKLHQNLDAISRLLGPKSKRLKYIDIATYGVLGAYLLSAVSIIKTAQIGPWSPYPLPSIIIAAIGIVLTWFLRRSYSRDIVALIIITSTLIFYSAGIVVIIGSLYDIILSGASVVLIIICIALLIKNRYLFK